MIRIKTKMAGDYLAGLLRCSFHLRSILCRSAFTFKPLYRKLILKGFTRRTVICIALRFHKPRIESREKLHATNFDKRLDNLIVRQHSITPYAIPLLDEQGCDEFKMLLLDWPGQKRIARFAEIMKVFFEHRTTLRFEIQAISQENDADYRQPRTEAVDANDLQLSHAAP